DEQNLSLGKTNQELSNFYSEYGDKNKVLDKEILSLKSSLKITDGRISTSVESLSKTIEERYNDNKNSITMKDSDIRTYITNNYSTKTQTDELISSKVVSLKSDITNSDNNLRKYVDTNFSTKIQTKDLISSYVSSLNTRLGSAESRISQTSTEISQTVKKNGVISAINQSAESLKIKASKIDLEGDVTLEGEFFSKSRQYIYGPMTDTYAFLKEGKLILEVPEHDLYLTIGHENYEASIKTNRRFEIESKWSKLSLSQDSISLTNVNEGTLYTNLHLKVNSIEFNGLGGRTWKIQPNPDREDSLMFTKEADWNGKKTTFYLDVNGVYGHRKIDTIFMNS
ncbi:MAG: hypothetical protein E7C85_08925, partial [Anaerococcus prevotii]|nr:hypothetical protein [Anaerococcus prevotii]